MSDFESVISLSGLKLAGKDELCRRLAASGYQTLRLSDPIRAEAVRRGLAEYTTQQLMDIGDEGRRQGGAGHWASMALEMAREKGVRKLIVNGVRNPGETLALQRTAGHRCTLVGVVAPAMVRFGRVTGRGQVEDRYDLPRFLEMDDRDRGIGQSADGQQVDRCLALVPPENVYNNDSTLEAYHAWIDGLRARLEAAAAKAVEWQGEFGGTGC
jgi:dephospho-CoA kinase